MIVLDLDYMCVGVCVCVCRVHTTDIDAHWTARPAPPNLLFSAPVAAPWGMLHERRPTCGGGEEALRGGEEKRGKETRVRTNVSVTRTETGWPSYSSARVVFFEYHGTLLTNDLLRHLLATSKQ